MIATERNTIKRTILTHINESTLNIVKINTVNKPNTIYKIGENNKRFPINIILLYIFLYYNLDELYQYS